MTPPPPGGTADQDGTRNDRPEGRPSRERNPSDSADEPRRHTTPPPPHDLDTEAALIGAILVGGRRALEQATDAGLTAGHFYHPRHASTYHAAQLVAATGATPDVPTVAAASTDTGTTARDLVELLAGAGYVGNITTYAAAIIGLAERRRLLAAAIDLTAALRAGTTIERPLEQLTATTTGTRPGTRPGNLIDIDLDAVLAGDLTSERPAWLTLTDGTSLLYPGRLHDIHAEPSVGKTWLGLTAATEVIAAGGTVLYLDFEDRPAGIVTRLLALGLTPAQLARSATAFRYLDPTGPLTVADLTLLDATLTDLVPDLAIIDGVAVAIARQGLSENSNDEVNAWADLLPRRIARSGAAVLMLDHVEKHHEGRARGARGAGAKLAIIDGASYAASVTTAYSRTTAGGLKLTVAKDRQGAIGGIGTIAAHVTITPDPATGTVTIELNPPAAGPWRPTHIMESVSRTLERHNGPLNAAALTDAAKAKRRHVDAAIEALLEDGHIGATIGPGGTTVYRHRSRFYDPDVKTTHHDDAPPHTDHDAPDEGLF